MGKNKSVKIGLAILLSLFVIVTIIVITYYIIEDVKINNENIIVDGEGILYLTDKGNLYYKTNKYMQINEKYFNDLKVKKLYCTLFCDYAYVVLENGNLYYLEKEYDELTSNKAIFVEQLKEETIKDILIIKNAEERVYILTESGKVYEHINGKLNYLQALDNYTIESIEGDSDIIFGITDSNKLIYWSNEKNWDKEINNYKYSTNVIEGTKYISDAEVINIMYVTGLSTLSDDKGYFIITTDGIYQLNGLEKKQGNISSYEFASIASDKTYIANDIIKTNYTYSEKEKVKLKLKHTYTAYTKDGNISEVSEEEIELGEFEKYVVQIENDGVILLNGKKLLYGESYHVPSLTVDAGTSTDFVFEKL